MSLRIVLEISDQDLKHFQLIMEQARRNAAQLPAEQVLARARGMLRGLAASHLPAFITDRIEKLEMMAKMLDDPEWGLPSREKLRVLGALAYLAEAEDLIPDSIPGVGLLDDAIMAEMVIREMRHEIDAYRDFCLFRNRLKSGRACTGVAARAERASEIERRRDELLTRIRRRRRRDQGGKTRQGGADPAAATQGQ